MSLAATEAFLCSCRWPEAALIATPISQVRFAAIDSHFSLR
jgi:hypothetical protein